jgi:hypothetical protein
MKTKVRALVPSLFRARKPAARAHRRGYAPRIESMEARQLLAANAFILQGVAYSDLNTNNTYDLGEELAGASITLKKFDGAAYVPVGAAALTGPTGAYAFTGLAPGQYRIEQAAPTGYYGSSSQATATLEKVTATGVTSIDVTLGNSDPNNWLVNYPSSNKAPLSFVRGAQVFNSFVGAKTIVVNETDIGYTSPSFTSYCVDLDRDIFVGESGLPFTLNTLQAGIAPNADRIAWIYNQVRSMTLTTEQAAGVQLAMYELRYETGSTFDVTSGSFRATGFALTTSLDFNAITSYANSLLTSSATKSDSAYYLDGLPTPSRSNGSQGLIAPIGTFNFANKATASLGDLVWEDTNANGQQDDGEDGVSGVTVNLTGTDIFGNPVTGTTTTDGDGEYLFDNLVPGTYSVTFVKPAGFLFSPSNVGDDASDSDANTTTGATGTYVLNAGDENLTVDAGLYQTAALGNRVWLDVNQNGKQDSGEVGVPGVSVTLFAGATQVDSTTTDANGNYLFTGLTPGVAYSVQFGTLAGYSRTLQKVLSVTDVDDSDASVTDGKTGTIVLASGETNPNVDAGLFILGSISGQKMRDTTGNGASADDTGLGGFTIFADLDNDAVLDLNEPSTITAPNGSWTLSGLVGGQYIIREVLQSGFVQTGPLLNAANVDVKGSGATQSVGHKVTLATGGSVGGLVFTNATIADCKTKISNISYTIVSPSGSTRTVTDLRGNVNEGDRVTANFTVNASPSMPVKFTLVSYTAPESYFNASTASQQEIFDFQTVTYTASGAYSLTVLVPNSNFQVDFVCGEAIDQLGPAGSNIFYTPQNRLISADNDGTKDVAKSSLSGFVYVDADNDGTFDSGETPISGALITLTGTDIYGNAVNLTTTTGANGKYEFLNLNASNTAGYTLTESQPNGFNDGKDTVGSQGGTTTTNDVIKTVQLNTNTAGVNNNFGERTPVVVPTGSISDRVWNDLDGDGLQENGELGVSGVTVNLLSTGGSVIATTTTNANGNYLFSGLAAGSYVVQFVLPTGMFFTTRDAGSNGAIDSDASTTTGKTATITLAAGQNINTIDAGLLSEKLGCEGGTPGYWKNNAEKKGASAWGPTGLTPSMKVSDVFSSFAPNSTLGKKTLVEALGLNGGGVNALLRHAVAAVLNARHTQVHYAATSFWIVTQVNAAVASNNSTTINNLKCQLDTWNNKYHPLDQNGNRI